MLLDLVESSNVNALHLKRNKSSSQRSPRCFQTLTKKSVTSGISSQHALAMLKQIKHGPGLFGQLPSCGKRTFKDCYLIFLATSVTTGHCASYCTNL